MPWPKSHLPRDHYSPKPSSVLYKSFYSSLDTSNNTSGSEFSLPEMSTHVLQDPAIASLKLCFSQKLHLLLPTGQAFCIQGPVALVTVRPVIHYIMVWACWEQLLKKDPPCPNGGSSAVSSCKSVKLTPPPPPHTTAGFFAEKGNGNLSTEFLKD